MLFVFFSNVVENFLRCVYEHTGQNFSRQKSVGFLRIAHVRRRSRRKFRQYKQADLRAQKKTGGDLPSVWGIEYTLSKTVSGKSAVISENQTATSDGETVKTKNSSPLEM